MSEAGRRCLQKGCGDAPGPDWKPEALLGVTPTLNPQEYLAGIKAVRQGAQHTQRPCGSACGAMGNLLPCKASRFLWTLGWRASPTLPFFLQ